MSQFGICHIGHYVAFGIMSHSALCRIRVYVVRQYVAFGLMAFGIMSHSALCCIRPYVVWLCVVRRIVVRRKVVRRNVVRPTVSVSLMHLLRLRIVQKCSRFGSSNLNDYISQIIYWCIFTIGARRFLARSLHDFLYTHEPLHYPPSFYSWRGQN